VHPIDHERDQVKLRQVGGEQVGQGGLGHRHEPARDRRLAGRGGRRAHLHTDRLEPDAVTAGGEPSEHPFHRHPAQHLGVVEQLVGRNRQLSGAVRGPHPRPLHRHPSPAQGDRTGLPAVTARRPRRVMSAPRPGQRGHVRVHQGAHHLQAGADGQGQQSLAHVLGDLVHRHADLLGHGERARVERRGLVLLGHGGPLLEVVSLADAQHLPQGRHQAGDRHLNFHETRDNLALGGNRGYDRGHITGTVRPYALSESPLLTQ